MKTTTRTFSLLGVVLTLLAVGIGFAIGVLRKTYDHEGLVAINARTGWILSLGRDRSFALDPSASLNAVVSTVFWNQLRSPPDLSTPDDNVLKCGSAHYVMNLTMISQAGGNTLPRYIISDQESGSVTISNNLDGHVTTLPIATLTASWLADFCAPFPAAHASLALDFQHISSAQGLSLIADTLKTMKEAHGIDATIELPMERSCFVIFFRGLKRAALPKPSTP